MGHDPIHQWLAAGLHRLGGDKTAFKEYKKQQAEENEMIKTMKEGRKPQKTGGFGKDNGVPGPEGHSRFGTAPFIGPSFGKLLPGKTLPIPHRGPRPAISQRSESAPIPQQQMSPMVRTGSSPDGMVVGPSHAFIHPSLRAGRLSFAATAASLRENGEQQGPSMTHGKIIGRGSPYGSRHGLKTIVHGTSSLRNASDSRHTSQSSSDISAGITSKE